MAEVPLLNLFPANVVTPDGVSRSVRAVVTPERVLLYGLVAGVPTLTAEAPVQSFEPRPKAYRRGVDPDYTVTTADGETWEIRKGGGCGCGNRLRSFNPFGGPNRIGT